MSRTPSPALRHAVRAVKLGVAVTVTVLAAGPVLTTTQGVVADRVQGPTAADTTAQDELDALIAKHDCSPSGFGPDVIPASALVERDDRVRHVSFDDGWATFTGEASGALLAVCKGAV